MTKPRLSANQVSSGVASGPDTKKLKNSFGGAILARIQLLENGMAEDSVDALKVSPLAKGSNLWQWIQPILSSGGHIVGAPVPTTSLKEATRMGVRTLTGLLEEKKYMANKPEYALPVLLVLLKALDDPHVVDGSLNELVAAVAYAAESPPSTNLETDFKEVLIKRLRYMNIAAYLSQQELMEDFHSASASAPHWRVIQSSFPGECSNKMARFIRRIMVSKFPKLCIKRRIELLREFCISPVVLGNSHPVTDFVDRCWSMRGSSISCALPKRSPQVVQNLLSAYGLVRGEMTADQSSALRATLLARLEAFEDWATRLHGGGSPMVWSDTLSKFASSVNPFIQQYNIMNKDVPLVNITSFVPYDLAPEMYATSGPTATGYFFMGRGMYYKYSESWRRDAVRSLLKGLLPADVNALKRVDMVAFARDITPRMAYDGGHPFLTALRKIGISEAMFTSFLRQYYWSGAFLAVNKALLQSQL